MIISFTNTSVLTLMPNCTNMADKYRNVRGKPCTCMYNSLKSNTEWYTHGANKVLYTGISLTLRYTQDMTLGNLTVIPVHRQGLKAIRTLKKLLLPMLKITFTNSSTPSLKMFSWHSLKEKDEHRIFKSCHS